MSRWANIKRGLAVVLVAFVLACGPKQYDSRVDPDDAIVHEANAEMQKCMGTQPWSIFNAETHH